MARKLFFASLEGGEELRRTAAVLRAAGREDLQRGVSRAVKAEGQPTLDDLKASARRVRISGERVGGTPFTAQTRAKHLRERMAAATVLEVRTGGSETRVSFHTVASRMGGAKVIPRYSDMGKPWRHPVMGRRKQRWAVSRGESWFFPPIKKHLPQFRERISAVLDEIVRKVEES